MVTYAFKQFITVIRYFECQYWATTCKHKVCLPHSLKGDCYADNVTLHVKR